jgi:AraC-like DNA-binding protein
MTMIRTAKINAFLREADRRGLNPEHLLRTCGVSLAHFRGRKRNETDFENVRRALTALASAVPSDFAATLGSRWSFKNFGIVGYGLLTYRQFGPFVDRWIRCIDFIGLALLFDSVVDRDEWHLMMAPREPLPDSALKLCVEEACAQVFPVYHELIGERFQPIRIETTVGPELKFFGAPLDHVPITFSASVNRLVMRRSDRDVPIAIKDDQLLEFCRKCCRKILPNAATGEFPLPQVRDRLLLSCGRPESVGDVAAHLGMSKRSLNRYLAKVGWTYAQLVNHYRRDFAMELLRTNQLCIKEVAFMVGFDSAGSLQRAFRQWTGVSVGQWLKQTLGKQPLRH